MAEWLHLTLRAPLMSFGGVAIDHIGPTRNYPSLSAITGLLGNALGYERYDGVALQALQDQLIIAALTARQGQRISDNQNARVYEGEAAWTTSGRPEARNKGPSYRNPSLPQQIGNQAGKKWLTHRRQREYLTDHETRVVIGLAPSATVTIADLKAALLRPARPLFIGRKTCLPTVPIFTGVLEAETALAALRAIGVPGLGIWPDAPEQDVPAGAMQYDVPDLRNWLSGLHAGRRIVIEGPIDGDGA
ncbi:CRISPR system Cascade subunit CasD [Tritonibacter multivorans]|uniref:CRISPR system Cascade subunit CasD n=1 Tax=Tritonibacter multivorans TaxID=928856 RepID=A0A0P1G097_9RHOB|nr:CRISPR system Cascade subunit CasD [Tritonibacter multivorans]SFD80796.1 CRISPR system Cascade subunit CasD [Tritonibacter multivorans]